MQPTKAIVFRETKKRWRERIKAWDCEEKLEGEVLLIGDYERERHGNEIMRHSKLMFFASFASLC